MIDEINVEREKSDRLTVAKLNIVKQFNKQDYKSKLLTEKYSLLPLNSQQLTLVQTAIQRMSEKHPDFEIPIQAQDLIKVYQHSTRFRDIYQYITDGKLPSGTKVQNCIRAKALNYVVINHFLFRIDT